MSDYVIAFDASGQPYLAHAFWNRKNQNGTKKDHKYYEKIKEGLKTRYFYSKQEWDAYQRNRSATAPSRNATATKASTSGTRSITGGKGEDRIQTGTNTSPAGRPAGHSRKVTGAAKEGSVYRRGDGLGSSAPVTGGTGFVPKTKKDKELAEAVESLADYKKKQADAKLSRRNYVQNMKEYAGSLGYATLGVLAGDKHFTSQARYVAANSKRDMKASHEAASKLTKEQIKAAQKFLKELGDYAVEAIKESGKEQADKIVRQSKDALVADLDKYFHTK